MSDYDDIDVIEIEDEYFLGEIFHSTGDSELEVSDPVLIDNTRPHSARRRIEDYFEKRRLENQLYDPFYDNQVAEEIFGNDINMYNKNCDSNAY